VSKFNNNSKVVTDSDKVDKIKIALHTLASQLETLADRLYMGTNNSLTKEDLQLIRMARLPAVREILDQAAMEFVVGKSLDEIVDGIVRQCNQEGVPD